MIYKLHKNGAYNIHTIKTDKFKTIRMEVIFRNNINPETIATRTCLFEMLMENSKQFKTKRDLLIKCEELYNASIYHEAIKLGGTILSSLNLEFLNPKFTKDDYLEEALKLPFDLLFHPNIQDCLFSTETLKTVALRMKAELASINENPKKKAIRDALVKMDSKSLSAVNILGSEDAIDAITTSGLYDEYQNVLTHDYIDIFIIGDFDEDKVLNIINNYASFKTLKNHDVKLFVDNKIKNKVTNYKTTSPSEQSQIVYIFNTLNLSEYERKYVMQIYNIILGGSSLETKLAQSLRNDNSLCYSVNSIYNKYDNLLIISTSVDKSNIAKAKKLIENAIKNMGKKISDDELDAAILNSLSSINMSLDSPTRIIANYLFNYIAELDLMDERIKKYKAVSIDEVLRVAKKIKLNTIYVLEGDENA